MAATAAAGPPLACLQEAEALDGFVAVDVQAAWPAGKLTELFAPAPALAVCVPQAASALEGCLPLTGAHAPAPDGSEIVGGLAGAAAAADADTAIPQDTVGLDFLADAGHVGMPGGAASMPVGSLLAVVRVPAPAAACTGPPVMTSPPSARQRLSAAACS